MVRKVVIGTAIVGAAVLGGGLYAQGAGKTVWDGVYTEAQATEGAALYSQNCAACHGVNLGGTGEAPTLSGAEFIANWNGLSLGELFDRIRTTMPFDRPGALSRDEYAKVVAHLLKFNGYPAGQAELSGRSEMLATIKMLSQKADASTRRPGPGGAMTLMAMQAAAPAAAAMTERQSQEAAARSQTWPKVDMTLPQNAYPNPFKANASFLQLPGGRTMGSSSAVATDSKGNIWIAERCGANSCATSDIDPIVQFDKNGKFLRAFGGGMFAFPHGLYIDAQDNIWLTDERAVGAKGSTVTKFSPDGKMLLQIGKPGVAEDGPDTLLEPNAAIVAPNGDIFIASGHEANKPATIKKYDRNGKFLMKFANTTGPGRDQLNVPHALAFDSKGRLFVADRWNSRIQIYDQNGKLLDSWTQFGRPSGLYIDRNDVLYSADSESRFPPGYGYNPNWSRGIRIGSARTGKVMYFIPDTFATPNATATSGEEGVWASPDGTVWGAQVQQKAIVRYSK